MAVAVAAVVVGILSTFHTIPFCVCAGIECYLFTVLSTKLFESSMCVHCGKIHIRMDVKTQLKIWQIRTILCVHTLEKRQQNFEIKIRINEVRVVYQPHKTTANHQAPRKKNFISFAKATPHHICVVISIGFRNIHKFVMVCVLYSYTRIKWLVWLYI